MGDDSTANDPMNLNERALSLSLSFLVECVMNKIELARLDYLLSPPNAHMSRFRDIRVNQQVVSTVMMMALLTA